MQGLSYNKQLHRLSWAVPTDVPVHAQPSSTAGVTAGKYSTLHPMAFTQTRDKFEPSFTQTYGSFGIRSIVRALCALCTAARAAHPLLCTTYA